MAIPPNLLPVNVSQLTNPVSELTGTVNQVTGTVSQVTGQVEEVTDEISGVVGDVREAIAQRNVILDAIVPERIFSGSTQLVTDRVNQLVNTYKQKIPVIPDIQALTSLTILRIPRIVPQIPSYGELRSYVQNRVNLLKKKKQEAFIQAQNLKVKKSKRSFEVRQEILNNRSNRLLKTLTNIQNR